MIRNVDDWDCRYLGMWMIGIVDVGVWECGCLGMWVFGNVDEFDCG